jgi:hypothetical protein
MGVVRRIVDLLAPPAGGPDRLVVAVADNEPQAELITQRLRAEGIESMYQTVGGVGFWAPWNPIGPREIIVNARDAERALLVLDAAGHPHHDEPRRPSRPGRHRRGDAR